MSSSFTGISSITRISTLVNSASGGGGGGDVTPNAVNWTDIDYEDSASCPGGCYTNSQQQITGISNSIILSVNWTANSGGNIYLYYKVVNTLPQYWAIEEPYLPATGYTQTTASGATFSVANNQYVIFSYNEYEGSSPVVTVRNTSDSNAILDTFTCTFTLGGGCLLTTAVVSHFGLADDGPELTAMRSLRSHYGKIDGYRQMIAEYYDKSPQIIAAIQAANAQSVEFSYIYNTVVAVMAHVNASEWQQAHDLYMAMYEDLKTRYLGV